MKIIDAHAHMISKGIFEKMKARALASGRQARQGSRAKEDFEKTPLENAKAWLDAAKKFGLEKIAFMATRPSDEEFLEFINSSEKFVGIATVNPLEENAKQQLEQDMKSPFKGIKLYPLSSMFHVSDSRARWIFEFAAEKKIPIVVHFGVTLGYNSDLAFGNPLDLDSAARDFSDVNFVIAHFGTTFFRETIMLAYQRENISIDTSGKNGWIKFLPYKSSLKEVFEKSLEIFGSERILFGSDTRIFPEGYRKQVLEEQLGILKEAGLNDSDIKKIFSSNAKRIFNLE